MPPCLYGIGLQSKKGTKFAYRAEVINAPKASRMNITPEDVAYIIDTVGRGTEDLAVNLKLGIGRAVDDFGLAVHRERQTPFTLANALVPEVVLRTNGNKTDVQGHFIPGCRATLPRGCVKAVEKMFTELTCLSSAPHAEVSVESRFMALEKNGSGRWEVGLSLTWKINWRKSADGPRESTLTVKSIIKIITTKLAEPKDIGLESLDSEALSVAETQIDPLLASTNSQASNRSQSTCEQQDIPASSRATGMKPERVVSRSLTVAPARSCTTVHTDKSTKVEPSV